MAITIDQLGVGGVYSFHTSPPHHKRLVIHVAHKHVIHEDMNADAEQFVCIKEDFLRMMNVISLPPITKGKTCQQVYEELLENAGELSPNAWFTCGWCEGQTEGVQ